MALESDLQSQILQLTNQHWAQKVHDTNFIELISGKEPGHRMADYVDDQTTALLKVHLSTRYESSSNGKIKKRSMGDVWVQSQGIYCPVNIKSGLQRMNGQPNLVSMQKLLDYIFRRWIDSYYLLIIKFCIEDDISHNSYLVDLLDWTEFITYNAGPGQIMLREREFYEAIDAGHVPLARSIPQKAETLFQLFERQLKAMFASREERLTRQRNMLDEFVRTEFAVDQSNMWFVP